MASLKIIMCIQLEKYYDHLHEVDMFQFLKIISANNVLPSKSVLIEWFLSVPVAWILMQNLTALHPGHYLLHLILANRPRSEGHYFLNMNYGGL